MCVSLCTACVMVVVLCELEICHSTCLQSEGVVLALSLKRVLHTRRQEDAAATECHGSSICLSQSCTNASLSLRAALKTSQS